ncbi:hypothetical protein [Mesorhizobium sp. M0146]|uniref:hypothetical protein n=1 Tax=unclassified Mesorhizobium TaxID=325217 RepID=UPI003338996F
MEDLITDDEEDYSPTPLANAVTAALCALIIGLALYGGAMILAGAAGVCAG